MAVAGSDPRATLPPPADVEPSARPVVARSGGGLPNWVIAAGIVVAGLILFLILDARRRQLSAPATRVRTADLRTGAEPPPLYVPPVPEPTTIQRGTGCSSSASWPKIDSAMLLLPRQSVARSA